MQYSGLGFIEAVEDLAHSAGMQVPRVSERTQTERAKKAPLTDLMLQAARFYKDQLKASPKAVDYLKGRGLTGEIAAKFGLGYAPDDWQGLQAVFPDYNDAALVECGLVIENEQGRRYDRFRDRVMFPIQDQRGNVIGFGGRVIGQGEPKYLNSPETPIFEKGRELYGLSQARRAIHDADTVIVVEGYMDVVGLAQLGVENVVASLGTATTGHNAQRLLRQANRVIFCFDRDSAGDRAARRAMENSLEFLEDGKRVDILQMPGNQDPDEYIREHGKKAFDDLVTSGTTPLSEFLIREVRKPAGESLDKQFNLATAEGRAQLIREAKPLLQRIAAPVLRTQVVKVVASLAELSQAEAEAECGLKPLARNFGGRPVAPPQRRTIQISQLKTLLRAVLRRPERAARLPLDQIDAESAEGAALHVIANAIEHGELAGGNMGLVIEHFRGSAHETLIGDLVTTATVEEVDEGEEETVFEDTLARMRQAELGARIDALNVRARAGLLAPEEQAEMARLLAAKARRAPG
jgi:DNA primase